ncbi:MAG TPA: 16S rRNA (cytosine(1402)-N(4))-methyltransferase RsmH, partial [Rhizomicrobium sp.]|nr:16S rRNA (cytosine(1402)-N(4))-methyltransferase RsmH [Rhizomicrobium sp.]
TRPQRRRVMSGHVPVMLAEVLEALSPRDGAHYVDGTFGGGGYASAILEAADCRVLGIDRDPDAIARGQALVERFAGRLTLVQGEFSRMDEFTQATDGVVLDLGVSSFQFDQPTRGFSFREDGPLDMRMSLSGESAADLVNSADERSLTQIIARYGEEKNARRIARAIIAARPVTGTAQLAAIVSEAQGPAALRHAIHPATRTFQALRIHVNDELGELERGLEAALDILNPQGRLVVVSFHSLEDRMVKRFLTERSTAAPRASRHAPPSSGIGGAPARAANFNLLPRRMPSAEEVANNFRARSATLRAGIKLAA